MVTATGRATAFGDIVANLASRPPETAFDLGIKRFSYMIARIVFVMVFLVLTVNLAMHRSPMESLLFAVALAVGLTPEFLPMITSVTLSRGAVAMARKHVVVKHLPAIQNLGSIDILCSDKTGTLTAGTMSLVSSAGPDGATSNAPLEYAVLNSRLQTGIRSPLDTAIVAGSAGPVDATLIDELPFDFQRRRLSVIVERDEQRLLICKGSPEGIFPLVTSCVENGQAEAMTSETLKRVQDYYVAQSTLGYRVLAVATRTLPVQTHYTLADEAELTLCGFVSFADTILPDAAETIARLLRDGISVKILTGDSELVAAHICAEAGLPVTEIVLGSALEQMSDTALTQVAERANVFARVSPPQKLRILTALRRRGHTVGFMGDGINDAPSLHAADVGISVATPWISPRTPLTSCCYNRGLRVLHDGILEGRLLRQRDEVSADGHQFELWQHVSAWPWRLLLLPFLPMLPTQMLLNNFLYDLSQFTIPTDNVDPEYFSRPQKWDIAMIRNFMILVGPISSIFDFLTFVLLHFFHAGQPNFTLDGSWNRWRHRRWSS